MSVSHRAGEAMMIDGSSPERGGFTTTSTEVFESRE